MVQVRRRLAFASGLLLLAAVRLSPAAEPSGQATMYVGTYTDAGSRGIYRVYGSNRGHETASGVPAPTGTRVAVSKPVCVSFAR